MAEVKHPIREQLRKTLILMHAGIKLREASWDGEKYTRDEVDCYTEAAGGDPIVGNIIYLFDHWWNDLVVFGAYLGIDLNKDPIAEVPACPDEVHYDWKDGSWTKIERESSKKVEVVKDDES